LFFPLKSPLAVNTGLALPHSREPFSWTRCRIYCAVLFLCRYSLMLQCWNHSPALRPSFFDIVFKLDGILASSGNEVRSLIDGGSFPRTPAAPPEKFPSWTPGAPDKCP